MHTIHLMEFTGYSDKDMLAYLLTICLGSCLHGPNK